MTDPSELRELAARLHDERARLQVARSNYDVIIRSRFHALRVIWFSIKQLLGVSSPSDVYATWSGGVAALHPPQRKHARLKAASLPAGEKALIEAWNRRSASCAAADPPVVTIVIPVFNHREITVRCLHSIAETWFDSLAVQFVIVDDASSDDTAAVLTKLQGIDYLRSGENDGFVAACNRAASLARGKYVCFLNNDTIVRSSWLDRLVSTAEADERIGIVGPKLIYPDGRLQEAGSIVWRDATGWNVGRYDSPDDPRYNYLRDVDYVSGAALLVRRDLFERVGRFSDDFRPAYYEDADLCFKVRALGYRVVYQPRSEVVHEDGASSGDDRSGVKRFEEVNRPKFREKWAVQLEEQHLENGRSNVPAASRRAAPGRRILIIDKYVPMYDKESGCQRMFHIIRMLRAAGYTIVFLPDNYAPLQPYTDELQQMGVEVLYHSDSGPQLREALDEILPLTDFAWISRPDIYEKYAPLVRGSRRIRVIYDSVDLHYVRRRREAELNGEGDVAWKEWRRIEAQAATTADVVVAITAEEKQALEELGARDVLIVPNIHEPARVPSRHFEETSGLLFIGSYNHPPNVDAAQWLCNSVMPIVWRDLPDVDVTLVGSNPNDAVQTLKSAHVRVTGYVRDAAPYFRKSRIFVAPLRFGAGMKGKIGQALEYALPVVTTPIGAEGFEMRDGENAMIAAPEPDAFAAAIVALYGDAALWTKLSGASAETLQPFTPEAVAPQVEEIFARVAAR